MPRLALLSLLASLSCTTAGETPDAVPELSTSLEWSISADSADLTRVTAIAVSSTGEIALAQPMDDHVKLIAPDRMVRTVGRDGAGPGEFRFPSRVGYVGAQLYVVDPQLYRVSLFDGHDSLVAMFAEPRGVTGSGAEQPNLEMNLQAVLPGGKLRMLVLPARVERNLGWIARADSGFSWMIRIDTSGAFGGVIAELPPNRCSTRIPMGDRLVLMTIPFCAPPLSTGFDGGELVALVDTETDAGGPHYRVRLLNSDGAALFDVRRSFTPVAVPQVALDSQRAASAERRANSRLPLPDDPAPAASLPPVLNVLVGSDSTVWLELEELTPAHTWLVLDRSGEAMGTVVLPAHQLLRVASRERLWVLEENADGLLGVAVVGVE